MDLPLARDCHRHDSLACPTLASSGVAPASLPRRYLVYASAINEKKKMRENDRSVLYVIFCEAKDGFEGLFQEELLELGSKYV